MRNRKIKILFFIIIIFLATILRLYKLGEVPPSPDWDEAALGYNAYSIMQTGHDEYGDFFPLILRSFDDYKPGLYAYLIIPFIKIFGLTVMSVRLPSALFGVLTVAAVFLLVRKLFAKSEILIAEKKIDPDYIALVSSFLLAVSPWHIQFSRIAFESNVGLALNIFVVFFFLRGLINPWFILSSFLLGSLNMYMYQSDKVFTPLLLLLLLIIFRKEVLLIGKRWIAGSLAIALFISLPMLFSLITNQNALLRAKGVSVFSDQTQFLMRNAEKVAYDKSAHDVLGMLIDNRRFEYVKAVASGYIAHIDLNWLFITGDLPRHHAPHMGLMYLFELPFMLVGIYQLLFSPPAGGFDKKAKLVVFSIFLLAPVPASFTSGVPHAIRTLNFLPTFQIFTAIGIITTFVSFHRYGVLSIKYQVLKSMLYTIFIISATFNVIYYLDQYFVQLNYFTSQEWQYGYREAVEYVKPVMNKYDRIIVSNKPPLDQSYIFFLFYLQYDPALYQKTGGTITGGFAENHKGFMNLTFRPIDWGSEIKNKRTLFIGRPSDFSENARVLKTVNYLDGKQAIKIVEGI